MPDPLPPSPPPNRPRQGDSAPSQDLRAERVTLVERLRAHVGECRSAVDRALAAAGSRDVAGLLLQRLDALATQLAEGPAAEGSDLDLAQRLLAVLMPPALPEVRGLDLARFAAPSEVVGGNLSVVLPVGGGHLVIAVIDASGQGLPAAAVTIWAAVELIRCAVTVTHSPRPLLDHLNRRLLGRPGGRYLRAFVANLDTDTMDLAYVNASHREPLWLRRDRTESVDTQGLFVGLFEDAEYEEKHLRLVEGETLLFYSDSVVDALRHRAGLIESAGLLAVIQEHRGKPTADLVEAIAAEALAHGGRHHHEDLVLLAIRCVHAEEWHSVVIPSDPNEGKRISDAVLEHCSREGFGERAIFAAKLALEEAITNAIKHGNKNNPASRVSIGYSVCPERLVITIADEGNGFDPEGVPDPTTDEGLDKPSGRGIMLMRHYMSSVEYNAAGNQVKLTRYND